MKKVVGTLRGHRGVVLITTLSIMMFLVMIATMLVTTSHNTLRRAAGYNWSAIAHETAVAGAAFAQTCMQADCGWMATQKTGVVIGPLQVGNVQVVQDFGSQIVHGFVFPGSAPGAIGEFRISFRAASTFPNDGTRSACVSSNNLMNDSMGTCLLEGTTRSVPKRTADIIVEGLCRSSANGSILGRRVVEVGFCRDTSSIVNLAASGGTMTADIDDTGQWTVQMAAGVSGNPGIRSMHDVQMYGTDASQFMLSAGTVHLVNGGGQANLLSSTSGKVGGTLSPVDASASARENAEQFTRVTFDQVKVTPKQSISAGTYVFWDKASSSPTYYQDLVYTPSSPNLSYAFNPDDHTITVTDASTNPKTVTAYAAKGSAAVPSGFWGPMSVNLGTQVDVQPVSYKDASGVSVTNSSLAIVADPTITDQRLNFNFQDGTGAVLQNSNTKGGITLRGEVAGAGSIVAKGDINFEGHSALSPNPNTVVTMYSGGDTTLQPILNGHGSVDTKSTSTKTPPPDPTVLSTSDAGVVFALAYLKMRLGSEAGQVSRGLTPGSPADGVTYTPQAGGVAASYDTSDPRLALMVSSLAKGDTTDTWSSNLFTALAGAGIQAKDVTKSLTSLGAALNPTADKSTQIDSAVSYILSQSSTQPTAGSSTRQWNGTTDPNGSFTLQLTTTGASWGTSTSTDLATTTVTDSSGNTKTVTVADQEFLGMIYACGNFSTNMPQTANVSVSGSIVAYGGDPSRFNANDSTTFPGANGTGNMLFRGKSVTFTYDPTYLGGVYNLFPAGRLLRSFYASY